MAPPALTVEEEISGGSLGDELATPAANAPADHGTTYHQSPDRDTESQKRAHKLGDQKVPKGARMSNESISDNSTINIVRENTVAGRAAVSPSDTSSHSFINQAPNGVQQADRFTFASSDDPLAAALAASLPHQPVSTSRTLSSASPAPVPIVPQAVNPKAIKIEKEFARLKELIKDASPQALHKLVRQEWRAFLYTPLDEDHLTYILRACLKNATPIIVERGVREILANPEFGQIMMNNALKQATTDALLDHLPTQSLIETVDKALAHVNATALIHRLPKNVLNEVVAHQLGILPANVLVNMLAKAGRLGYSVDDVIEEESELVLPPDPQDAPANQGNVSMMRGVQHNQTLQPLSQHAIKDPLLLEQEKNLEIQSQQQATVAQRYQDFLVQHQRQEIERQNRSERFSAPGTAPSPAPASSTASPPQEIPILGPCAICTFTSPTRGGQAYHAYKKPCQNALKQSGANGWAARCTNCDQTFTQSGGLAYHEANKVCSSGKYAISAALPTLQRPTFDTSRTPSQAVPAQDQPACATDKQIPRPRLLSIPQSSSTPQAPQALDPQSVIQAVDPNARVNPSHLSPEKKAEMDAKIEAEDLRYQNALVAIASNPEFDDEEKERRRTSQKNMNATKKSQIRKKFGASLRLRERDKMALKATALSSHVRGLSSSVPNAASSYSSPAVPIRSNVSTPSSGFSPINVPSSPNVNPGQPAPTVPPQSKQKDGSNSGNANGVRRPDAKMSGFGILKTMRIPPTEDVQNLTSSYPNKRQRTSSAEGTNLPAKVNWIQPLSQIQSPLGTVSSTSSAAVPTIRLSSDDSVSNFPKKRVPVSAAQAKWEALQPRQRESSSSVERVAEKIPPARKHVSNTQQEVIEIDSSSDTDVAAQSRSGAKILDQLLTDKDQPFPSTEDTESENAIRPTSSGSAARGRFMARRGGRHS